MSAESKPHGHEPDKETKDGITQKIPQGLTVEEYKATLSKRALRKYERKETWKVKEKERLTEKKKRKADEGPEPGFDAELYDETDYFFENGLRKVYPYYFTFSSYVKARWVGRNIVDVFSTEFRAHSKEEYIGAIEKGNLTCNGKPVTVDHILENNELLCHRIHRHENPVVGGPIEVLDNTDDLVVINKPSTIPCHPCGKYRHNSVVFIIGRQLGCANLRNIYRLDRMTSGVLIMGKTSGKTKELEDQVREKQVSKEYVCRVVGHFPDGKVDVNEPLGVVSNKLGLFKVRSDGKPSHTTFEKISYNGKSSVVKCFPHTGRTHQIRVHLQYLGHPIVNDPFYNSEAWGPSKAKGGVTERTDQEVSDRLMELHNIGHWTDGENPLFKERLEEIEKAEANKPTEGSGSGQDGRQEGHGQTSDHEETTPDTGTVPDTEAPPSKRQRIAEACRTNPFPEFDRNKWIPDPLCDSCRLNYVDPTPRELVMYLHALKYKGPNWEYSTPLPDWAKEEWTQD